MRRIVLAVLLTLSLSACNTVQGIGEDFKAAGNAIKDTANDVRHKMVRQ